MNLYPTVFVVKESWQDEKRVSLVPRDVYKLVKNGFNVLVEDQAGLEAGFNNDDYELVGAKISKIQNDYVDCHRVFF